MNKINVFLLSIFFFLFLSSLYAQQTKYCGTPSIHIDSVFGKKAIPSDSLSRVIWEIKKTNANQTANQYEIVKDVKGTYDARRTEIKYALKFGGKIDKILIGNVIDVIKDLTSNEIYILTGYTKQTPPFFGNSVKKIDVDEVLKDLVTFKKDTLHVPYAFAKSGKYVYVSFPYLHCIKRYELLKNGDTLGNERDVIGQRGVVAPNKTSPLLTHCTQFHIKENGNIVIIDTSNRPGNTYSRIVEFKPSGNGLFDDKNPLVTAINNVNNIQGITSDDKDNLFYYTNETSSTGGKDLRNVSEHLYNPTTHQYGKRKTYDIFNMPKLLHRGSDNNGTSGYIFDLGYDNAGSILMMMTDYYTSQGQGSTSKITTKGASIYSYDMITQSIDSVFISGKNILGQANKFEQYGCVAGPLTKGFQDPEWLGASHCVDYKNSIFTHPGGFYFDKNTGNIYFAHKSGERGWVSYLKYSYLTDLKYTVKTNRSSTDTYRVTAYRTNGKVYQADFKVYATPSPTITSPKAKSSYCKKDIIKLNSTTKHPATSQYWFQNGGNISNFTQGRTTSSATMTLNSILDSIYLVAENSNTGCKDTTSIQIKAANLPTVAFTSHSNNDNFCPQSIVTFIVDTTNSNQIQWFQNKGDVAHFQGSFNNRDTVALAIHSGVDSLYAVVSSTIAKCTDTAKIVMNIATTPSANITSFQKDEVFCSGQTISLQGSGNIGTAKWIDITSGSNSIANTAIANTTATANISTDSFFFIAADASNICFDTAKFNVTIIQTPTANISPPKSGNYCSGSVLRFIGDGSHSKANNWLENNTTPTNIQTPNNDTTLITVLTSSTSYQFVAFDATNKCSDTTSLDLANNKSISVNPIKMDVNVSKPSYCPITDSIKLKAIDINNFANKYVWFVSNNSSIKGIPPAKISSPITKDSFYAKYANYIFVVASNTNNTCVPDTVMKYVPHLSVCPANFLVFLNSNFSNVCHGSTVTLTASLSKTSDPSDTYQWLLNGVPIAGQTSPTLSYSTPTNAGKQASYSFSCQVTRTYKNNIKLSITSSPYSIHSYDNFDYFIELTPDNKFLCPNSTTNITAIIYAHPPGQPKNTTITKNNYNYNWSITNATNNNTVLNTTTTINSVNSTNLPIGQYKTSLTAQGAYGRCPTTTINSDTLIIEAKSQFNPTINISTDNPILCLGTFLKVSASTNDINKNQAFQWFINNTLVTASQKNTFFTNNLANKDTIHAKINPGLTCIAANTIQSNKIVVNVANEKQPKAIIRNDFEIFCKGSLITLQAIDNNQPDSSKLNFQWFKNDTIVSNTSNYIEADIRYNDSFHVAISNNSGCVDTSAHVYAKVDAITDRYTPIDNFTFTRTASSTISTDNAAYMLMGRKGGKFLNDLWRFDPQYEQWEQLADFPDKGRIYTATFKLGDFIYTGLGFDTDSLQSNFYQYNINKNTWKPWHNNFTSVGGSKRYGANTFVIGDYAYLFGGYDYANVRSDFFRVDKNTLTWHDITATVTSNSTSSAYPNPRYLATSFVLDNFAYLGLGNSRMSNVRLRDFWKFDPNTLTFNKIVDFPGEPRSRATSFIVNNIPFIAFGFSQKPLNDVWIFNPNTPSNPWYRRDDATLEPRFDITAFSTENIAYLGMGNTSKEFKKDFWKLNSEFIKVIPCIFTDPFNTDTFCIADSFNISFEHTFPYFSGNIFTAQLSNNTGSFDNPITIGTINSDSATSLKAFIPKNTPPSNNYKIRVVSSKPLSDSTFPAPSKFVTLNTLNPTINIAFANPIQNTTKDFCSTDKPTLFINSQQHQGANPKYLWFSNDTLITSNSDTFINFNDSFNNSSTFKVALINTDYICLNPDTAFSNKIMPNVITINTNIAYNNGILTVANNGDDATYSWVNCTNNQTLLPNSLSNNFNPTTIGLYKASIAKQGCVVETRCTPVDVVFLQNFNIDKLYPNPAITTLKVTFNSSFQSLIIRIYSLEGEHVLTQRVKTSNSFVNINIEQLPSGPYILAVTNEKNITTSKQFIRR